VAPVRPGIDFERPPCFPSPFSTAILLFRTFAHKARQNLRVVRDEASAGRIPTRAEIACAV
jgi:hypothetical protein